jgi:hypothetical protein
MGVSIMYSAIPPSSTLYARLQHEKALSILVNDLFIYGSGIFSFFDEDPYGEVDEIIKGVVESHQDVFGSIDKSEKIINEFRAELYKTREDYPGIENRTAMIEKSVDAIEKCLTKQFVANQVRDAEEITERLLFGDQSFAPNLLAKKDEPLGLISRDLVHEGASLLRLVNPETLYTGDWLWDEWGLEHLKRWRDLYLVADEMNEEILVGAG